MRLLTRCRLRWLRLRYRLALRDLAWIQRNSQQCLAAQREHLHRLAARLDRLEAATAHGERRDDKTARQRR